jgi:hypothetical protein
LISSIRCLTLIDQRAQQSRNWTVRGDVTVIQSIEDADGLRCVDLIAHPDGTFAFKEFRRDPEDGGRWPDVGFTRHRHINMRKLETSDLR